jgi:hypothetical protein
MAYTVTKLVSTVWGNHRVLQFDVTADAATQTVVTTLGLIYGMAICPASMMSQASLTFQANSNATGVRAYGSVGMSGLTNGDHFYLTVIGR